MALVYISSTFMDLQSERQAAYQAVRRLRHDAVAMEDYVAADERPLERCLADVRRCDIYVGLFGWRYGYVPPGRSRSITELEFREAKQEKKPCLIFMQNNDLKPRPVNREDRQRIEELRAWLGKRYLASFFNTPEDLAAKVTAAVANVFGELSEAIGKLNLPVSRVLAEISRMGATPPLAGPEMLLEVNNLQRDAMHWISDGRYLRTAELRLAEARRLIASGSQQQLAGPLLLSTRGYVEKTAAQICEGQGDTAGANKFYQAAARYFRAALKLDPSDVSALNGQANVCQANGEYRKAATIGRVVVGLSPDYAAAYWDLGIALTHLLSEKPEHALIEELADVYETLVRLLPDEPSGFTPDNFAYAQECAQRYRQMAQQQAGPRARPLKRAPATGQKGRVAGKQRPA